jgi:hypothetical protein
MVCFGFKKVVCHHLVSLTNRRLLGLLTKDHQLTHSVYCQLLRCKYCHCQQLLLFL